MTNKAISVPASAPRLSLPVDGRRVSSIDVSPDGRWVACWAWSADGNDRFLFVSPVSRARWRRVAAGDGSGFWRPDSSMYVFELHRSEDDYGGHIGLVRTPRLRVREFKAPFHFMLSPSWTPDGYISVFCSKRWRGGPRLSYNGDPPEREFKYLALLHPNGRIHRLFPMTVGNCGPVAWSPDGSRGAFAGNILKAIGLGWLCVVSSRTGQAKWDSGNEHDLGNVDTVEWLNNQWLLESSGVEPADRPKQWHDLFKGTGRSGSISAWMPDGQGGFYAVSQETKSLVSYNVWRSELWRGVFAPRPHLTKQLASLPFMYNRENVVADFDPAHHQVWILAPNGKSLRAVDIFLKWQTIRAGS